MAPVVLAVVKLVKNRPELANRIVPDLPFCRAEIVYSLTDETSRTLVDLLPPRVALMLLTRPVVEDACGLIADTLSAIRQIVTALETSRHWLYHIGKTCDLGFRRATAAKTTSYITVRGAFAELSACRFDRSQKMMALSRQ